MTYTDIARRVYNHSWKLDPIIRSILDTDFYKLLMQQMIWSFYKDVKVTFSVANRNNSIKIADLIDEKELREQLDHARTLRLSKKEMIWLRGNSFYNDSQIFNQDFLSWLEHYQLPEYELEKKEGQYNLRFYGNWCDVTLWEIPALAIISELYARATTKNLDFFALDVLYARAKAKVWHKITRLQKLEKLAISDFGTRRRHSFLWQRWCVEAMKEGLDKKFLGTSNILLAMMNDLEAIGTNAHELPMVLAAISSNEQQIKLSPYKVLVDWQKCYNNNLLIVLPDNFGTHNFLENAPDWVADWSGMRLDSMDPIRGGETIIKWWQKKGKNPKDKLLLFSDALDIDDIEHIYYHFAGRVRIGFGWGTKLTNDFVDCAHKNMPQLKALSLVCKVTNANGKNTVKLSDNLAKAIGEPKNIEYYKRLFNYR